MRLVQATIPPGSLPEVTERLEQDDVDYFVVSENATGEYDAIVYFAVPQEVVEPVVGDLYEAGLDPDDHVLIIDAEVDIHGETAEQEGEEGGHKRIAASELKGRTDDLLPDYRTFLAMVILSGIVATTGLLLDSVAVVVGAMVIAPLFGPAVSTSVGTVVDEDTLFKRGVKFQVVGVVTAIAGAALFAWFLRIGFLIPSGIAITTTPQIADRLSPDVLSLVVALVAGIAGVISVGTGSRTPIVGVMIAAALLPPAAVVGIGMAWGEPMVALNAGVLLVVNVLAINFAGLVTLWYLGYRPQSWVEIPEAKFVIVKRAGILLVAMVVVSGFLVNVTLANVQQSNVEDTVEEEVTDVLDRSIYENVSLVDVKAVQDESDMFAEPERVVVTVGRPPDEPRPAVRQRIDEQVRERLERDVSVDVRVVLVYQENTGSSVSQPLGGTNY